MDNKKTKIAKKKADDTAYEPTWKVVLTISGFVFAFALALAIGLHYYPLSAHTVPAKPYLNTSHFPNFTPYTQNTNLWLIINGSTYQYWATLDNYAAGQLPCILTMSAVKNGSITHTLNRTEAITTLSYTQIVESSGNSPNQTISTDAIAYFGGLFICQNYNMTK
jgi:hypothetical protein